MTSLPVRLGAAAAVLCLTAGCGSAADPSVEGPEVTMAPQRFDGSYAIEGSEGGEGDFRRAELMLSVADGTAEITGRCRIMLGSFTLVDEGDAGPASFTLPGFVPGEGCPPKDLAADRATVESFERVERWEAGADGQIVLLGGDGTRFELAPTASG